MVSRNKILSIILSLFCLLNMSACQSFNSNLTIYCFQAGKADAFLITTDNYTVLLDTAESSFSDDILDYLNEKNIESIDYMIITHFDKDHVGGAGNILKEIDVKHIYQSNYPKDSKEYEKYLKFINKKNIEVTTVSDDITLNLDGIQFIINGPKQVEYEKDPSNNSSLIVSIFDNDISYLFMGDSEDSRINEFIADNANTYNLIKIPYHGHYQDSLEILLDQTNPEYALITSSDEEKEDDETISLLNANNIHTLLTRENALTIQTDGTKIKITQ